MLLKIIRPLLLAAIVAFLTPGCDIRSEKYSALVEPGVSASLADLRRDLISDISYRITLSVPSEKDSSITGHETVSFHSSSRASIPLDFTRSEDEHILLRAKKGTNSFDLDFVSDNRFLNRNEEYLYSLFVPAHARSVFPCFDQPDLKARFTLSLEVPEDWTAVSNTAATDTVLLEGGRKRIDFAQTEPVSTYLFAFVAGKWSKATSTVQGRDMNVYYRETDPDKIARYRTYSMKSGRRSLGWKTSPESGCHSANMISWWFPTSNSEEWSIRDQSSTMRGPCSSASNQLLTSGSPE